MVVVKSADEVLADLEVVGAVGESQTPVVVPMIVDEVVIEQGPPSVTLKDLRGDRSVEILSEALNHIDEAVRVFTNLRKTLEVLREVWAPVDVVSDDQKRYQTEAISSLNLSEPGSVSEEEYVKAREKALRKIRGEGTTREKQKEFEDEENIPYVGQIRAIPVGQEPEEVTIGTIGTIKPSFPVEE